MEHIRQHDWFSSERDEHFVLEPDVDNCVTEKILRNKFFDPLISSDSEDESTPKITLNWDEIFKGNKVEKSCRKVVQGLRPVPPFTKLSALTAQQHYQCLKVLCSQNPDVMPEEFFPRPTKQDYRIFEELKETYEKEQAEFIEWARSLWTSEHCVRALRPKPPIESVYEAEFKVWNHSISSFPKSYNMVAQIGLECPDQICEITHQKDIISVNMSSLPKVQYPDMSTRTFVMKSCPLPEPCTKHPCRFVLPNEDTMTLLPLTEVHKELAQFALTAGATAVASEGALACLMQRARRWTITVSVCEAITQDGDTQNVVVLGNEFAMHKETAQVRTYKAYKRLLEHFLVAPQEQTYVKKKKLSETKEEKCLRSSSKVTMPSSDDEDDNLYIDMANMVNDEKSDDHKADDEMNIDTSSAVTESADTHDAGKETKKETVKNKIDFYSCSCEGTVFAQPPPRSYRRWRLRNNTADDHSDVIVHAPHTAKGDGGEVVLEAVAEYQLELGASGQSPDVRRTLALALSLRKNASVLNVHVDSVTGEVVGTQLLGREQLSSWGGEVAGRVWAALQQLRGLRPGHYLLHHEPTHGNNALLYGGRRDARGAALTLGGGEGGAHPGGGQPAPPTEQAEGLTAPTLVPLLLPVHKYRRILPCAFTPYPNQVGRTPRRPPARQRTPPQAIKLGGQQAGDTRKWPKNKKRRKKKAN